MEMSKTYDPKSFENKLYKEWVDKGYFKAKADSKKEPFTIVIPPPNITGQLHIGHALNDTIQDVIIRFKRMQGFSTLWLPGTDHASIATEVKIVEKMKKEEGLTKQDVGRDGFLERAWAWKEQYGGRIVEQLKKLGASCDWSRETFTMDEKCSKAVREVFVNLYNKGLIYKGDRIINWCPCCKTALSDAEVEYSEQDSHLWHIRYPLSDGSGEIIVATTRPETMLGDTAVAVNPKDERYVDMIGKTLTLPLVGKQIPIVADEYVEKDFGSGAVKITPAHDPNDFEVGLRHNLQVIRIMNDDGSMNDNAGAYKGLDRVEARKRICEDLQAQGFMVKIEDYKHNVGECYRCHATVEPIVSKQWFVKMQPLAKPAIDVVRKKKIEFIPSRFSKVYFNWMENIKDWCISRQLWWGHRIPAYYCGDCGELVVDKNAVEVCPKCGGNHMRQDEDVLDTWFSSSLWPFSTMGWPDETEDLKTFYPTSVLVTAFDILFFWVARMIMMGQHFMGEVPFRHVYIHALVRDEQGRKMSKSLGNGIDPFDMINKYGADALRFTLVALAAMGRDIRMSEPRIEGYRHFMNKLWNASRFALMNLEENAVPASVNPDAAAGLHNRWILHRLEEVKAESDAAIESYRFNDAAQGLYKFLWSEFCDWYLELIKGDMKDGAPAEAKAEARFTLYTVLREMLVLLHPIIPFVTAEVWQSLPGHAGEDIALQLFPEARPGCLKPDDADDMIFIQETISAIRTIRAELNINPSYKLTVLLRPVDTKQKELLEHGRAWFMSLARLENLIISADEHAPKASASNVVRGCEVIVHLSGAVDFQAELARLDKELGKVDKELAALNSKLSNENFITRAKPEFVEQEKARAADFADKRDKMLALQKRFREVAG